VREALFDILGRRVHGSAFLDAFAGTGAVGLEALSRGAARAVFLERDRSALAIIRENLALGPWGGSARVLAGDVLTSLRRLATERERFSIAFLDPPYDDRLGHALLASVALLVEPGGVVIAERRTSDSTVEAPPDAFRRGRAYRYGDTSLTVLHRLPGGAGERA
jgi:16S rRNA (guanine(966)-N(2))-methyltransferase RsmD